VSLLPALDLLGVFVFALSGATLGVARRMDLFGVVVLGITAAIGGGLARDVLLGALPPDALRHARYLLVATAAGLLVFVASPLVERLRGAVRLFDAAGLGLFVATGTSKALAAGLGTVGALTLGCLTGIGGGLLRDLLAREVPVVLQRELYAVPALLGAGVVVVGDGLDLDRQPVALTAALVVFTVRMVGHWRGWQAPVASLHRPDRGSP
jgi:uncharacterized membrane protein YeiH